MSGENNVQDLSLMLDCFITVYGDNFLLADFFGNFCALLYCMAGGVEAITPCPGALNSQPIHCCQVPGRLFHQFVKNIPLFWVKIRVMNLILFIIF